MMWTKKRKKLRNGKKKYPFQQPIRRQHSYKYIVRWNYELNIDLKKSTVYNIWLGKPEDEKDTFNKHTIVFKTIAQTEQQIRG